MNRFCSRALALSVSLLVSLGVCAANVWDGAPYASDPQALLAAAEAIKPAKAEDSVIVLLDEATVTFDEQGRSTRVERLIFRVLDESAVEGWSTIDAEWSPWYLDRPVIDARVVTKDGSVHRLDPKSFETSDADDEPGMFTDTRNISGPIPAVAPGSVVEQTITYRQKNTLFDAGVAGRHYFGRWVETRQSRLTIEHPAALALRLVNDTRPSVQPRSSETNGIKRLVFETGPSAAMEGFEWNLPTDITQRSYVAWSTGKSWQDVARRYAKIVDEKIGDGSAVAKYTATAIGNAKEPREIASRILNAIQRDIRYAGVELGEGSIVPRTPAETLKNKYGDCKDKATLLVAMLRQAGLPAHAVLIRAGQSFDVHRELPGLGHFNHVIVRTGGAEPMWIDPTDEYARAGELPDSDQGRLVLIAHDDTTELTQTPLYDSSANRIIEQREFWLAEEGKSAVVETGEYFGSDERSMRRYYTETDRKQLGEGLESYAEQAYLSKKLARWTSSDTHDLSKPFRLTLDMKEATRGVTGNGEAVVAIFMSRLVGDLPQEFHATDESIKEAETKPRVHDYVFAKPHVLEVRYRVHPPAGYQVRNLPSNETLKVGTGTLTKHYSVADDGVVLANFTFDSGPRRITPAQHEELRKAVVKLDAEPAFLLYFDQLARKYLDAGEVGKAVVELRRLIELHPKEALHHTEMARALLTGGLGAAALREAKRATEIDPKSAGAHATLAFVLLHDPIGREMRSGSDVKAAIAAYRKAKALDPTDLNMRAELAMTLQHDDAGNRFGDKARMNEAIAEYLALKKEIEEADDAAVDRELMALYANTGRWDELKTLLGETSDRQSKDVYTVVHAGATGNGAAAITASLSVETSKRREVQTQAGGMLTMLRIYPAAAELIRAAAQGAPNAVALRTQADVLARTVRYEDVPRKAADVSSVVRDILFATLNGASRDELSARFTTKDVADVFAEEGIREKRVKATNTKLRREMMNKGPQSKVALDVAVSAIDLQQDGDEQVGLRLRARVPGGKGFVAYVVREDGQYRFAATDDSGGEFGLRALRLTDKNDLAAARQWLDWAREHITAGSGDDPVSGEPFASYWTRGREATADEIRLAAAMLLPDTKKSSALAIPILTAARANAAAEVQPRIDQALLTAYRITEKWDDVVVVAQRLSEKYPQSTAAFLSLASALEELGRHDELRTLALARLEKFPGDNAAQQALGSQALHRGDYAEAVKRFAGVLDRSNPSPGDYNNAAWAAVFAKGDLTKAAEDAQHAAGKSESYAVLNTLAVIYAEQGKTAEARETLLKSLEQKPDDKLGAPDWYIVGRIAESYGIREAATEAYAKIEKPKRVGGTTWTLAQERLAKLK
jgi:tetratricopeptide (TPR) repeat protein